MRSQAIIDHFDKAAATYDSAADIQVIVADHLVQQIRHLNPTSILDIGCGTGLLTERLAALWPDAAITALDSSAAMLGSVKRKIPRVTCVQGDASTFQIDQTFDLITSSMLLHWLPEPALALEQWRGFLSRYGTLMIALPLRGSLSEWQTLCQAHGVTERVWHFPKLQDLGSPLQADIRSHNVTYATTYAFLRKLKETGAHSPRDDTRPFPAALRHLLRTAPSPMAISYKIGYCWYGRGHPE